MKHYIRPGKTHPSVWHRTIRPYDTDTPDPGDTDTLTLVRAVD
jgi:hypothetical protein